VNIEQLSFVLFCSVLFQHFRFDDVFVTFDIIHLLRTSSVASQQFFSRLQINIHDVIIVQLSPVCCNTLGLTILFVTFRLTHLLRTSFASSDVYLFDWHYVFNDRWGGLPRTPRFRGRDPSAKARGSKVPCKRMLPVWLYLLNSKLIIQDRYNHTVFRHATHIFFVRHANHFFRNVTYFFLAPRYSNLEWTVTAILFAPC